MGKNLLTNLLENKILEQEDEENEEDEYDKESEEDDIHQDIIDFFLDNPNPEDEQVQDFAEELGIDPDELEQHIYMILSNLLRNVGKHRDADARDFDEDELKRGIEIEMEHTDDPYIALEIAKDHLAEIPDYYTRLDIMEKEALEDDSDEDNDESEEDDRN